MSLNLHFFQIIFGYRNLKPLGSYKKEESASYFMIYLQSTNEKPNLSIEYCHVYVTKMSSWMSKIIHCHLFAQVSCTRKFHQFNIHINQKRMNICQQYFIILKKGFRNINSVCRIGKKQTQSVDSWTKDWWVKTVIIEIVIKGEMNQIKQTCYSVIPVDKENAFGHKLCSKMHMPTANIVGKLENWTRF